jgi:uncharacterized membrane protein
MITTLSLILVLVSAVIHPVWNILLKRSDHQVVFYLHIHLVFTVLFSFLLFVFPVTKISSAGWVFIMLSALSHFLYQVFLCRTYELGDISLTYPVIRSSPIFVALLGFIFLKELPSPLAMAGIILIITGTHVLNLERFTLRGLFKPLRRENRRPMIAALFTALFSAVYSAVDKKGVLEINPVLFFYLFFAISGLMFAGYVFYLGQSGRKIIRVFLDNKFAITIASILEFSSYVLILYAFRLSKVAYVVALRQISVVFAALFGTVLLKEKNFNLRLAGSLILFTGAFLITVCG